MQKLRTSNLLLLVISLVLGVVYLQSCKKTDNCEGIQCQNGGICSNGACYCPSGFGGDNCEINLSCQGVNCQNGGTCVNGTCNCPTGLGGDNCEIFLSCDVLSPLCPTNSTCDVENGVAACYCNAGYEGAACDTLTRTFYTNGNTFYTPLDVCTVGGPVIVGQTFTYNAVKITNGVNPDEFIMEGLGGFSPTLNIKCKITGPNTFIAVSQIPNPADAIVSTQPNTNGTLNRITNTIVFPYKIIYDDASIDMCTVTLTRQ